MNALARTAKKHGVMDVYAQEVERAQARSERLQKKASAKRKAKAESESDSEESANSMNNMEDSIPRKRAKVATPRETTLSSKTAKKKQLKVDLAVDKEEKAFLRSVVQTEQKEGKKRAKKATLGTVVKDDNPTSDDETSSESDSNSE